MGNNWTNPVSGGKIPKNADEYNYGQFENPDYAANITKTFIIGLNGVAGCDANFAAPANPNVQSLDLGLIIPAQCVLISASLKCTIAVVGVSFDFDLYGGNVSGGNQFILLQTCYNLGDTILSSMPSGIICTLGNHFFVSCDTQGDNWNVLSLGKWLLTINYKDYSKL
jgi:hypothetical protein